jgi:hypothetical protein
VRPRPAAPAHQGDAQDDERHEQADERVLSASSPTTSKPGSRMPAPAGGRPTRQLELSGAPRKRHATRAAAIRTNSGSRHSGAERWHADRSSLGSARTARPSSYRGDAVAGCGRVDLPRQGATRAINLYGHPDQAEHRAAAPEVTDRASVTNPLLRRVAGARRTERCADGLERQLQMGVVDG